MIDHTLCARGHARDRCESCCGGRPTSASPRSACRRPCCRSAGLAAEGILTCLRCRLPAGRAPRQHQGCEAAQAGANGAQEVDMVIDVGGQVAGGECGPARRSRRCRGRARRGPQGDHRAAAATATTRSSGPASWPSAGADFVKTSTGFHARLAARRARGPPHAGTVGGRLGIKASGGIRTPRRVGHDRSGASRSAPPRRRISAPRSVLDRRSRPALTPTRSADSAAKPGLITR